MAFKFDKGDKRRKDFKTQDQYLDYIFDHNKSKLMSAYTTPDHTPTEWEVRERFKGTIESYKVMHDTNVTGALAKLGKTKAFTPVKDRLKDNVWQSLKNYDALKTFQGLTRGEGGRFAKYDPEKLKWDRENQAYIYGGAVMISFDESPQQLKLTVIATGDSYYFGGQI